MTEDNAALTATLKAGKDFDAPWLVIRANDPNELATRLQGIAQAGVHQLVVDAANTLKAVNNAQAVVGAPTPPAQPQQQWGGAQQQAPAQSTSAPQYQQPAPQQNGGGGRFGGEQHPEGLQCHCGKVVEKKKSQGGKSKWQCPDWRWNNGSPNGHYMEWIG